MPGMADPGPRYVGIVLFPGVEELDAVGPWEVLSYWTRSFPDDGYVVVSLSADGGPVECAKGMVIEAQHSFADCPALDVLIHPGGHGTRPQVHDEKHLAWLQEQREAVPLVTSVCTGSLVLAAAGLLRHRPATTHWRWLERLAELDPTVRLCPEERYVDDGDVITSAGVSAGIDMALHLVRRLAGAERAAYVRHGIQYDPRPPV